MKPQSKEYCIGSIDLPPKLHNLINIEPISEIPIIVDSNMDSKIAWIRIQPCPREPKRKVILYSEENIDISCQLHFSLMLGDKHYKIEALSVNLVDLKDGIKWKW